MVTNAFQLVVSSNAKLIDEFEVGHKTGSNFKTPYVGHLPTDFDRI
jgi:hypothetical protein